MLLGKERWIRKKNVGQFGEILKGVMRREKSRGWSRNPSKRSFKIRVGYVNPLGSGVGRYWRTYQYQSWWTGWQEVRFQGVEHGLEERRKGLCMYTTCEVLSSSAAEAGKAWQLVEGCTTEKVTEMLNVNKVASCFIVSNMFIKNTCGEFPNVLHIPCRLTLRRQNITQLFVT